MLADAASGIRNVRDSDGLSPLHPAMAVPLELAGVYSAARIRKSALRGYAPRVYAERRQRVRDAMGPEAVAILLGARHVTRSRDTDYPFRQDSDFWYLTGFDHPNAVAVLRTDGGP